MKYEERVVCFIDILGFKSIIRNTVDQYGNCIENKVDELSKMLYSMLEFKRLEDKYLGFEIQKNVTQFSDSIVISFPVSIEEIFSTLIDIQHIIMELINYGVLIRGGISYGRVIHNSGQLFGPAMNEAYELESKKAIYPRVLLSDYIINELSNSKIRQHYHHEIQHIFNLISQDDDKAWYIDYLYNVQYEFDNPEYDYYLYLDQISSIIISGLQIDDIDTRLKYEWLKNKYNNIIFGFRNTIQPPEVDPEIFNAYVSLPII